MPETLLKNRVRMTSETTGTGTLTLLNTVVGYAAFSEIGDGNACYYTIVHDEQDQWEVGIGTYTSSGQTLSRDTILNSSNAGAAVSFSSGTKDVFVSPPWHILRRFIGTTKTATYTAKAGDIVYADISGSSFTINLPSSPLKDEQVAVMVSASGTGTWLTVGRNGKTIDGASTDLLMNTAYDLTLFQYDGTGWVTIAKKRNGREQLTAARTYYVRTDGSDSNTGLVDSAGGAFLTIQQAINTASALDNGGFSITIQVGDGTRTASNTLKSFVGSGVIAITGNTGTPANCVINATSAPAFNADGVIGVYQISGFKLTQATAFVGAIAAEGSVLRLASLDFGTSTGIHVVASNNANIRFTGDYSITGNAGYHWYCDNAILQAFGRTVTLTGTPAWSSAFMLSFQTGFTSAYSMTFTGAATGTRYLVTLNGVVQTGGGGANYFPGDVAGAASTGGVYA